MNDTLNPPRSSFLAFAQSRALKESEATEAWQRLTEQERNDFVKTYWDTQARALDQGGRIKRKNPPKKFPQLILFFGLLAAFAAVGYWSYINFQPKFTPWDWSVIFIDESYTLPAEPMIHSRSVMLLEREEPFDSKMELGRGIDLNNNVLAEVVNFEAEAQGLIQPEMKTFLEVISEEKQRSNIIKEMAHASIPTKGLGGGIEFLAEVEANETSMYIIMATTVTIRKTRVKGADLKPHIKALAMNISLHNFISLYGTHYISGYTSAAQFIGVIEIRTENAKDKFQVKAALNSTGFPNALAALEIGLEQRKVAHRKNVRMYVKGVNIQKTPMSVQELLAAHEEFIMETRKAPAMPVAVTCSPFSTLPAVQSSKEFLEALENFTVTKGRIEFDDKTYEGFIEKDVPEGYGVMRYDDGEFYEGAWKRGQRSGYGINKYANNDMYVGWWKLDKPHGKGKFISEGKYVYEGGFLFGKKQGKGILKFFNGDHYEGDFSYDFMQGKGTYLYTSGDKYEGYFERDRKNGEGKMTYKKGYVYTGDFKNGLMEGEGIYEYADGKRYVGSFKAGLRDGHGALTYTNGDAYVGGFKNDKEHGKAICEYYYFGIYWGKYEEEWQEGKRVSYKKT